MLRFISFHYFVAHFPLRGSVKYWSAKVRVIVCHDHCFCYIYCALSVEGECFDFMMLCIFR